MSRQFQYKDYQYEPKKFYPNDLYDKPDYLDHQNHMNDNDMAPADIVVDIHQ